MKRSAKLSFWIPHKKGEDFKIDRSLEIYEEISEKADKEKLFIHIKFNNEDCFNIKILDQQSEELYEVNACKKEIISNFVLFDLEIFFWPTDNPLGEKIEFWNYTLPNKLKKFFHKHETHKDEEMLEGYFFEHTDTEWLLKTKKITLEKFIFVLNDLYGKYSEFISDLYNSMEKYKFIIKGLGELREKFLEEVKQEYKWLEEKDLKRILYLEGFFEDISCNDFFLQTFNPQLCELMEFYKKMIEILNVFKF